MKRILTSILVMAMCLAMGISASANVLTSVESGSNTAEADVTATCNIPDVYSVQIEWGALTYVCTENWDPETRTKSYVWTSTDAGTADTFSFANSSNVAVDLIFEWKSAIGENVKGIFTCGDDTDGTFTVNAPAENASAVSASATLALEGRPNQNTFNNDKVGTVTITIAKSATQSTNP